MRAWSWLLALLGGIWVRKIKVATLPKDTPYIVCCNHTSYLDIVLMYRVFSDYFVMMGKGEIENWPLFNVFFKTGMNILVYREKSREAHRSLELAKEKIDKGQNIVIFPEGGIYKHAPFIKGLKNGAFKMAIVKQVPIVPMTFETNWRLLQGTVLLKGMAGPGISKVHVHEPISTTGLTLDDIPELRAKVKEAMEGPLLKYHPKQEKGG